MLTFLLRQLRFRRSRALALGTAVLVAAASFVLLTAAGKTTELRVQGSVESNFRAAYDVLVRPRGSMTTFERTLRLVRPNYLSGIYGGITLDQWQRVKQVHGVDIAAPIANIGYVLPFVSIPVPVDDLLTRDPVQVFRVEFDLLATNGTSRYADGVGYVYYTRENPFFRRRELTPDGRELDVCGGFIYGSQGVEKLEDLFQRGKRKNTGPFRPSRYLNCFSALSPRQGSDEDPRYRRVGSAWSLHFPLLLAAIDPVEEGRLMRLDRAIVSGRYLREDEQVRVARPRSRNPAGQTSVSWRLVPALASTRQYLDERLGVRIERLVVPRGTDLPTVLASRSAYRFLTSLRGEPVERRTIRPQIAYQRLLGPNPTFALDGLLTSPNYWTPSDVRYARSAGGLSPTRVTNPPSIWENPGQSGGYYNPPRSNIDVQFRRLRPHVGSNRIEGGVLGTPAIKVVGRFDPEKLPGFSPLSRVPLETYYPPLLEPADQRSRAVLGGKPLLPTQNIGDYVQQPPLLLTTLEGMKPFLDPGSFAKGVSPARRRAPISVIRIKVKGVTGPDQLSMARIRSVATRIRDLTGLDVDITAGSSPQPQLVDLPAGKFGRPRLSLREGWSKKGVSVSFLQALDEKRLGLLALVLVACAFFVANGAYAAVRGRRMEIGTLLTLGWSPRQIFAAVLGELAAIGLLAGVLGSTLAFAVARALELELSLARALLVVPLAFGLTLLAGLLPAARAARSVPLDAVRPVVAGTMRGTRTRSFAALALSNLRRVPARSLVAGSGLLIGVAALTLLVAINQAFQGTLVGTLLGDAISVQVRGLDFLTVGLIVALAGLSVADVLYLNLRERQAELVTLRTVGWADRHLARLVAYEAFALGLVGSLAGAVGAVALGAAIDVPLTVLVLAAVAATLGGVAVSLLASLLPISQIGRVTAPTVLAAAE